MCLTGWRKIMLHKISDMCDKIDSIKKMSDNLRRAKYSEPKQERHVINELIENIQSDCLSIAMDKGQYWKPNRDSVVGIMSPEEEREWKLMDKMRDVQNRKIIKDSDL